MNSNTRDFDITKSVKAIEWLKAELVSSVGSLMKAMTKGSEGLILECITGILITLYILGKRLGISFSRIDMNLRNRLRESVTSGRDAETWNNDLTNLLRYVEDSRK